MAHLSFDKTRIDLDWLHSQLSAFYWSKDIRKDIVERGVANSLCCLASNDAGEAVGFARVVTDYATFAWICDVFVIEECRRQRIGHQMMDAIMKHPELQTLRRWSLGTGDAHGVYRDFGFETADVERMMQKIMPVDRWREHQDLGT